MRDLLSASAAWRAAVVLVLTSLYACVGYEEDISEQQQAEERIEVHSCRPGWLEVGDVCIDPWHGGGSGGGGGGGGEERRPGGPGGGGGGCMGLGCGTGGPGRKPDRKQCGPELGVDGCLDCCYYNYDKVDGWVCRKKRKDSDAERRCWEMANDGLSKCQRDDCDRHGIPVPR